MNHSRKVLYISAVKLDKADGKSFYLNGIEDVIGLAPAGTARCILDR